jgi:hypothetical protein
MEGKSDLNQVEVVQTDQELYQQVLKVISTLPYDNFSINFLRNIDQNDKGGGNCYYLSRYLAETVPDCCLIACKKYSNGVSDDNTYNHVCLLQKNTIFLESSPLSGTFCTYNLDTHKYDGKDTNPANEVIIDGDKILFKYKEKVIMIVNLQDSIATLSNNKHQEMISTIIGTEKSRYVIRHENGMPKFIFTIQMDCAQKQFIIDGEIRNTKNKKTFSFTKRVIELSLDAKGISLDFIDVNRASFEVYLPPCSVNFLQRGIFEWINIRSKTIFLTLHSNLN